MVLLSVLYVIKKAVSSGLSGMISDGIKSVVPFIFLILGIILFFFGDVLEKRENKKKREEEERLQELYQDAIELDDLFDYSE